MFVLTAMAMITFSHLSWAEGPGYHHLTEGDTVVDKASKMLPMPGPFPPGPYTKNGPGHWEPNSGRSHYGAVLAGLGLGDKQKESIRQIEQIAFKETVRLNADLWIARLDIEEILRNDPVDMKTVEDKVRRTAMILADLELLHIRTIETVRGELTEGQREEFRRQVVMNAFGKRVPPLPPPPLPPFHP